MSVFMIETDAVSSAASSLNNVAANVIDSASSASSWDTSNDDGFDFASAKNVIASNIEACANKIKNTANLMDAVVENHTSLQEQFQFDPETGEQKKNDPKTAEDYGATTPADDSTASNAGQYSNGGYSSGKSSGGKHHGYSSQSMAASTSAASIPASAATGLVSDVEKEEEEEKVEKQETPKVTEEKPKVAEQETSEENNSESTNTDTPSEEEKKIENVSYAAPKKEQLSKESQVIINDTAEYTEDGYSMIDDRYVIACGSEIGKVGDVVRFTSEDGKVTECVVGINTVAESNKNKMFFIVDEQKTSVKPLEFDKDILNTNTKIDNLGNYQEITPPAINLEENTVLASSESEPQTDITKSDEDISNEEGDVYNA